MNCERCKNSMVWEGNMRSGKMTCKLCESLDYSQYIIEELTDHPDRKQFLQGDFSIDQGVSDRPDVLKPDPVPQFLTVHRGTHKAVIECNNCGFFMNVDVEDIHMQCVKCGLIGEIRK